MEITLIELHGHLIYMNTSKDFYCKEFYVNKLFQTYALKQRFDHVCSIEECSSQSVFFFIFHKNNFNPK